MGVAGSGKSTIGRMLAQKFAIAFHDADDYHPEANKEKMKSCIPLDDQDRLPWLSELATNIVEWNQSKGAVLACSALKEKYRQILSQDGKEDVIFIYLKGNMTIIVDRMKARKEHFFSLELLESQFNTLEEPQNAFTVQIDKTPEEICTEIVDQLINRGLVAFAKRK